MTPEQLKASILQMAIQGKLVEQCPEDGTAEELFQMIQKERKKYTIKEISIEDIGEEPFDIPETWKWIHLQDIVKKTIKRGRSPKYAENSKVQVFAQKCNVKTGGINMELALFLDEASIEKYPAEEYMCDGDIVINSTGGGTMGRVGIFHDIDRINDMAIVPDGHVTVIRACDSMDHKYLYYCIKHNQKYLETQGEGSTNQTELKPLTIASLLLPLPPLKEQHRIVAKIEELLPYVDRYAEAYEKLEQFNAKFPEDMKKSILQYAIQGKLVEQRPEEGTAEELYQQIQKEKQKLIKEGKLKKEKPLAEITEDEIPFEIPESWKWVYVGDLFSHNTGKAMNSSVKKVNKAGTVRKFITTSNVYWNRIDFTNVKEMFFSDDEVDRCTISKGDLLMCEGGAYYGRTAIWSFDYDICFQNHIHRLRPFITVDLLFFYYVFYLYRNTGKMASKGTAMPGLSSVALHHMIVPLPPYKEQHRIVAKIEELLPYCDQLIK